jgi:hypothetical protein
MYLNLTRPEAFMLARSLELLAAEYQKAAKRARRNTRPQPGVEINYRIAATEAAMLRKRIMEHIVAMGWE